MGVEDGRASRKAKPEAFKALWVEYHDGPTWKCASWPLSPEDERRWCAGPPHRLPVRP